MAHKVWRGDVGIFLSGILHKIESMSSQLNRLAVEMYARGLSTRDVEKMLRAKEAGEITDFLGYEKYDQEAKETDNSRNGHTTKGVQSKFGEIELEFSRDRKSEFEPIVVKKRQ